MNSTKTTNRALDALVLDTIDARASRREGNTMRTRNLRRAALAATVLAGLTGGGLVAGAATFKARWGGNQDLGTATTLPVFPKVAQTCATDCAVGVEARASDVTVQDAVNGPQTIPVWGFRVNGSTADHGDLLAGTASAIKVPVGTTVTITLSSSLPGTAGPLSLSFPSLAAADVTVSGNTYTVRANKVGTSVYEAGPTDSGPRQVAMGLVGAFIVTPSSADCVSTMCAFDGTPYQDETVVATNDLDAEFAASPTTFDMSYYGQSTTPDATSRKVYHLINGKAFPDTDVIEARQGDKVLLRYVNAGVKDRSLGLLGLHQDLLGRNADAYVHPQTVVSPLVGPGETADVAVAVPATAAIGQRFALTDQSERTANGTGEGFGGAMTFLNIWGGTPPVPPAAPVVSGLKFNITTGKLEGVATATAPQTVVSATVSVNGATPIAATVSVGGGSSSAYLGATDTSLTPGAVITVVATDSLGQTSTPQAVTVLAAPTVTGVGYTPTTPVLAWTATISVPLTLASIDFSIDNGLTWTTVAGSSPQTITAVTAGTTITVRATDSWGQTGTGTTVA